MGNQYHQFIEKAKKAMEEAEYFLIGGGSGLSTAAGSLYSGKRFTDNFAPFIEKYGMTDMYSAGFYPFQTQEEKWAYWAKHISVNRYETSALKLYQDLFALLKGKNYFIITTNVDSHFEKGGFSSNRIFEVQGNYGNLQCAKGCHDKVYHNEQLVKKMVEQTVDCKVPTELVPKCPVCGGNMDVHLRINEDFVQDEKWYEANDTYNMFLEQALGKKMVFLELGVGFMTPTIIRHPFERMTYQHKDAVLIRFNKDYPDGIKENVDKTIAFTEDMQTVVSALLP